MKRSPNLQVEVYGLPEHEKQTSLLNPDYHNMGQAERVNYACTSR